MVLSIIICTYNRVSFLKLCLNSILNQIKKDHNIEIIVIDNNSTDETKKYVEGLDIKYIKYHIEKKQGLSFARNRGIEVALGRYLAFVDDDAIINSNWLDSLLDELKKDLKNHIYGGPIYPKFEIECPKWIDQKYFIRKFKSKDGYLDQLTAQDGFSGGNMCISKETFTHVGHFNTNLGMKGDKMGLGEESELFFRILNKIKNIRLYNIENMSITHFEAKFKLKRRYLKERITLSSIQFTKRLLTNQNKKSKLLIYGKLLKQIINFKINLLLSMFITKRKFKYLKNYWIITGILKTTLK